jgi:hypothetical protein
MRWLERAITGSVLFVLGWALIVFHPATPAAAQQGGATAQPAAQRPAPAQMKEDKSNMELVGFNDLQARSSYQPVIHQQGNRWIAYIGHHGGTAVNTLTGKQENNGTSIVDVTNPKQPKYLAHIPGAPRDPGPGESGGAQMVRVCDGSTLPHADRSKVYMLRSVGGASHEIWDVTVPEKPSRLTVVVEGLRDTHKSFWECGTGIAYLVGGAPGWRVGRMTMIYDLSDPAKPVFIRYFGLPGQQPGSTGPVPTEVHGMISVPEANRVYFGYGTVANGITQIVDRDKLLKGPKEPTDANLVYPQVTRVDLPPDAGGHTAYPLLGMELPEFAKQKPQTPPAVAGVDHVMPAGGPPMSSTQSLRNFVLSVGETTGNECLENRQMLRVIDVTTESRPFGVATWTVPEASGNFCDRGGRFGTHSLNENLTPIYYRRLVFLTEFNAGVRALDIRDPLSPKEVAHYIPAVTDKTDSRCVGQGAAQKCKIAIQTNNAEVDDRGYIYIVDRANTGMHVLQLTGAARQIANWPTTSQR